MTSSITATTPYSYFDTLQAASAAPATTPGASTTPASTDSSSTTNDAVTLSSTVQALLQGLSGSGDTSNNPMATLLGNGSSTSPIQTLLGGSSSSSDSITNAAAPGVLASVYSSLLQAAYSGATQKASDAAMAQSAARMDSIIGYSANATTSAPAAPATVDMAA